MTDLAETLVEPESPGLAGRNLVTASHLMGLATAFFFLAFVFAFTYLRTLDGERLFRPKNVNAPTTLGAVIAVLFVAAAVAIRLALTDQRGGRPGVVRLKLGAALAFGLGALAAQIVEWATLGFGPNSGGYASVFVGWTGFEFLFAILALYWVETQFATALRQRDQPVIGLDALAYYWTFLAGLGVVAWIVLYTIT
jgi:cytochrome c oxidase subunit 3